MNHELKCLVKETPDELSYRKKYFLNSGESVKSEDLLCRICDDTLTKNSFKIHPTLGILLCKQCYEENKSPDKQKCMVCNEDGKLIECKSKKCSYLTCEKCMTRLNPAAKSFYKQGKWNCFACHTKPLYKLRGMSAVMASNSNKDQSNKAKDHKTNGQLLSRSDSTSSSGTEFTISKIIDTNLYTSRSKHHNLSEISDNESHEDDTLTNRQLLDFKHNVKKSFDSLKEIGNKLLEEVDKAQQNFHSSKHKLKSSDVVNMVAECKNIIQHVQDSTNKQEKKLIERHKTWCRKSKIKNTLFENNIKKSSKKQNTKKINSSDEDENDRRASTPIKNTERIIEKTNSKLNVSDCDEQVFSGDEPNRITAETTINHINNNSDVDVDEENPLDVSKDLFSDDGLPLSTVEQPLSSKSSKKSSDESTDNENDKRKKKRFLKVKKFDKNVESDDESSSDSSEKVKPKRRLSKTKFDKIREKSNSDTILKEIQAKTLLLQSSSSDNNNEKNKLSDCHTDDKEKNNKNKSLDSDFSELEDPTPTKGSKKQLDDSSCNNNNNNNDKTDVNIKEKENDTDNISESEQEKAEDEAKNDLLKSSSESDNNDDKIKKKKKLDEEAKNSILNSSSDSENLNNDDDDDDKAKKDLLNSCSESDKEENLIKKKEQTNNNNNNNNNNNKNNSSSDNETTSSKSKKRRLKNKKFNYSDDKKLKLKCIVELNRLDKKTLSQHTKALRLSAEYLENKKVSSLLSLDGLDKKKKKKKHRSDSSTDESSNSRSRKKTKTVEDDTLMDHFEKVETGNGNNDSSNSATEDENTGKKIVEETEPSIDQQVDKIAKFAILASSESSDNEETPVETLNDSPSCKNSKDDGKKKKNAKKNENNEDDEKKNKGNDSWKRSKLLTSKIIDSDSDVENIKAQKKLSQRSKNDESDSNKEADDSFKIKKKSTRTRRRRLDSDSDVKISDDSGSNSDDDDDDDDNKKNKDSDGDKKEGKKLKRKKRSDSSDSSLSMISKKNKTKRRRIRAVANDSDDSSDDDDLNSSQGGANKSGRKNIRKVLKDKHVDDSTLQAAKQEEERIKRMAERQKLYNEMYEARLASEAKVDKLVLDFDAETKQVLLEVDENLVKRLKPHQAKGIKFMWDACFESLERIKESAGSGCILAHCMGLGKSFQVVTLSHTLLTHSEKTGINTILIVVPLSTVLNWMNEFKIWLSEVENGGDIELYEMTKAKTNLERRCHLENWQRTGGVLIIGYEMFRNLCAIKGKVRKTVQEAILKTILDPGPDLIVCDEGHLLKNEDSAISKAIRRVKTLRRIVLTGTPLQNNLIEYHCMVQFVKPNLLGTKKEFSNRFVNPIQNGQFDDSTEYDVKLMKKRAHVLHKMLEGSVQRFDYSVLTPFLPPKQEYVISIRLTPVQVKLYQYYIDNFARKHKGVGGSLFADFQALSRLWTHPFVVKLHTENSERIQQKKREAETDSEGSLKDFIDDGSDSESSTSESSNSSNSSNESDVIALDDEDGKKSKKTKAAATAPPLKRGTRANPVAESEIPELEEAPAENREWWTEFIKDEDFDDMRLSAKLMILFDIIKEAEAIGDKVLVFSQSLYSLTLIEKFLGMIDDETQNGKELDNLDKHTGCWAIGQDYFRFDGQTSAENRSHWVKSFNKPSNTRARLFLISTRAGGLGINLTAANRVVIFDASWNPSHDVQSIFRIYRFGQKKPCYVYRLLAAGTMEEKIYNRQVTKLSLSCRVVDELQIERHYSNNDLAELYRFDPPSETTPDLALPKDRLLAEIFLRHKNLVETFHEHDSLLENIAEEELDAEERKQAWQEYEDEKAGKRMIPPQMMMNYSNINPNLIPNHQHMLMMQQYGNQMINSLNQLNNPNKQVELSQLMSMFQQDYPQLNEQQHRAMALKALSNMYNYVENQMIGRGSYNTNSVMPNPVNSINNPTATLANALAQQEYTRLHSGGGYNQQNLTQQQRQMMYSQSFGNNSFGKTQQKTPVINPTTTTTTTTIATAGSKQFVNNDDSDDIIEIPSSSNNNSSNSSSSSSSSRVNQASNAPKRQEE